MSLSSRERLLTTLNHKEADRIPIFPPNIMDTHEAYDPELVAFLESFDFDRFANLPGYDNPPDRRVPLPDQDTSSRENQILVDGYGCRYQFKGRGLPYCIHHPLADAQTVADVHAFDWPDPDTFTLDTNRVITQSKALQESNRYMTFLNVPPIFHQYHYIRGFEQWMLDIALNPGIHEVIATHISDIHLGQTLRLLEHIAPYTDLVGIADDLGTSTNSYMSPGDFRKLIKPHYKRLIGTIKARYPHIRFYMHTHGQVMALVPDLIECGIDILNPILPLDNMDAVVLKREYGKDLCFHAGIDIERIIPFGTVEDTITHVKRMIDVLAPEGGYWFKLQAISPLCPPANVIAAYETALAYGIYPLHQSKS